MEEPLNICQTCLSPDRRLVSTVKMAELLREINYEEINNRNICWECESVITTFYRFRKQAKNAQRKLSKKLCLKTFSKLLPVVKCAYDYEFTYNSDPLHAHAVADNNPELKIMGCDINKVHTLDHIRQKYPTESIKPERNSVVESKKPVTYPTVNCIDQTNYLTVYHNDRIKYPIVDCIESTRYAMGDQGDHKELTNYPMVNCKSPSQYSIEETQHYIEKIKDCSESDSDKTLIFADCLKNCKEEPKGKRSIKQNIEEVDLGVLKKYETVLLTEADMLRIREEKRNHPNYKKIPYKCDTCVLGFTTKDNFNIHFEKKHHEKIGPHQCNVCSTRFQTQSSLSRHHRKHFHQYACTICEYKTSAVKAAVNHCRYKHEHDERDRIHCKQCDGVFRTPEQLQQHTRTEHIVYCNDCGEKFKGKRTLRTHQVRIHGVKREFVCDVCTRSFLTKSRLESHLTKHSQTLARRLAYCAVCGIQYRDIHVYRNHLRNSVNHSQDRYQCSECDKKFASKVYRTKHYNFFHLKKSQYNCVDCDKLFISEWRLKNHRQKHHGLTRSRNHGCDHCGKKFYTLATLRGHQLTHSERRQYMCENCGDTFKQRPALYTHARLVHKGGKGDGGK